MIQDYLKKLQQLQLDTFGTLVNIEIDTHYDTRKDYPWLAVYVTIEGYHTQAFRTVPSEYVYLSEQMYGRMYETDEENEAHQAAVYAKVETFVKEKLNQLK